MIPWNRPDDDTLGSATPEAAEHNEQIEKNTREQFDLRLRFAEAVAAKKNIPLIDAMRDFTDMHVRLTGKRTRESEQTNPLWQEFSQSTVAGSDHGELLEHIVQFSKRPDIDISQHEGDRFYPFRYSYDEESHEVRLHFGSMKQEAGDPNAPGVLSSERLPEMRGKLTEMFTEIKKDHPDAQTVRGSSWLYNRKEYRRLYPVMYTAHPQVRLGNFTGGGTWGQFRDKTGAVNDEVRKEFLTNLEHLDPEYLENVFPNKTLMVSAPISEFYKEYGI